MHRPGLGPSGSATRWAARIWRTASGSSTVAITRIAPPVRAGQDVDRKRSPHDGSWHRAASQRPSGLDREAPPRVHQTWILARLKRLEDLLRRDPVQAKAELAKHLDGELMLTPLPSVGRDRRAEIRGRAKLDGLLEGQEAVLQYVGCGGWI